MGFFLTFVCIFAFRQVLCTWRENVLALIHESKATTRADEHYRRAILSKVGCVQQVPRSQYRCWFRQGSGNTIRRTKNINIRATAKWESHLVFADVSETHLCDLMTFSLPSYSLEGRENQEHDIAVSVRWGREGMEEREECLEKCQGDPLKYFCI